MTCYRKMPPARLEILRRASRLRALEMLLGVLIVSLVLLAGCRASSPEGEDQKEISIDLDVVPMILKADTTETATVWVTVLEGTRPVADSTIVNLVATLGTVPAQVLTTDGLAIADFQPPSETGVATIIAQSRGVRDTMNVTLY